MNEKLDQPLIEPEDEYQETPNLKNKTVGQVAIGGSKTYPNTQLRKDTGAVSQAFAEGI